MHKSILHKSITLFPTILLAFTISAFGQKDLEVKIANEYYGNGELEKALTLYETISKNHRYIPQIHDNYLSLLLDLKKFNEAHKYLSGVIKKYPGQLYYILDRGLIYRQESKMDLMDQYYKNLIDEEIKLDNYKTRISSQYFIKHQLVEFAIYAYEGGRSYSGEPWTYSFELASIYRMLNRKEKMIEEYLTYLDRNPNNIQYVRKTLQVILTEPEDLENLEVLLYKKIQNDPDNSTYNELLIWVNLQQRNFSGAFIQARALDRRSGNPGDRAMNIGIIAIDNKDFNAAARIFDYIVAQYPNTANAVVARHYRIKAEEEIVKSTYPIDLGKIRALCSKYDEFINEIGLSPTTLEAYRNKAQLHAFYLDEKDSAILILSEIISHPRASGDLRSKSKLDLGDIYILTEETWESTLLYSQVEKSMKESPLGYEAKLRNAKLSYFKGDFKLAQDHLDILKEATTREISNDAMSLSLLIRDNTGLDSTEEAMRHYAEIELMLFQNKSKLAKTEIDRMLSDYPSHSLVDELLWLKSKILRQEGNFQEALEQLNEIETMHFDDVLGDDAYYTSGLIHQDDLHDEARAMEIFNEFLTKYPGSIYAADARKRFRTLRGDFDAIDNPVN